MTAPSATPVLRVMPIHATLSLLSCIIASTGSTFEKPGAGDMESKIDEILEQIMQLEEELLQEIERRKKELAYQVINNRIRLATGVIEKHKKKLVGLRQYLAEASWRNIATTPVIWMCFFPAVFMDLIVTIYHAVCFPVYGIPKVERSDYIYLDRHFLQYLNVIEKLNCVFCGYFNGLIAYVQEIAARTEQYWCPIKHARKMKSIHSRYQKFFDYGDAAAFRSRFARIRKEFDDLSRAYDSIKQGAGEG